MVIAEQLVQLLVGVVLRGVEEFGAVYGYQLSMNIAHLLQQRHHGITPIF